MYDPATRANSLDHVVVVLFENRSLDNVLGHLYGPEDGKTFEGVIGKDLSQSDSGVGRARCRAQGGAVHGCDRHGLTEPGFGRGVVPHQHAVVQRPRRAQPVQDRRGRDGAVERATCGCDADDGRVRHRLHQHFTAEVGRQPTYEEYAHIMTGYTPEQVPVLNAIARDFGVFDHWFCEVPSQTFMNRSFWTAATSSGLVVNSPAKKWFTENDAETIFERIEQHGKTWKVYVQPMPFSFEGVMHSPG